MPLSLLHFLRSTLNCILFCLIDLYELLCCCRWPRWHSHAHQMLHHFKLWVRHHLTNYSHEKMVPSSIEWPNDNGATMSTNQSQRQFSLQLWIISAPNLLIGAITLQIDSLRLRTLKIYFIGWCRNRTPVRSEESEGHDYYATTCRASKAYFSSPWPNVCNSGGAISIKTRFALDLTTDEKKANSDQWNDDEGSKTK